MKPEPRNPRCRTLRDGTKVEESEHVEQLTISTRCPKKWAFVGVETGEIWVHNAQALNRRFCHAEIPALQNVMKAAELQLTIKAIPEKCRAIITR
jgi:hypothetical protein